MSCFGKKRKRGDARTAVSNPDIVTHDIKKRPVSPSQVSPAIGGQANLDGRLHESCNNKLKARDMEVKDLETDVKRLKGELSAKQRNSKKKEKERKADLKEKNVALQSDIGEKDKQLSQQAMQLQDLMAENDRLLTRISEMASSKLRDGNENIADLSDQNRPTKLAEKYSELYDNEWTDAYDLLKASGETEENTNLILLKALCAIYIKCRDKANMELQTMTDAMKDFLGDIDPSPELVKTLKDQRKKRIYGHTKALKKVLKSEIKTLMPLKEIRKEEKMKAYLNKCIELCWLMVIQDPPVFMDVHIQRMGEKFDTASFKPYTKTGLYIDFIVWPPIYLKEGGSILFKGIAQGTASKTITETDHHFKDANDANTEQERDAALNVSKSIAETSEPSKPESKIDDSDSQEDIVPSELIAVDVSKTIVKKDATQITTQTEHVSKSTTKESHAPNQQVAHTETARSSTGAIQGGKQDLNVSFVNISANGQDTSAETALAPTDVNKTKHLHQMDQPIEQSQGNDGTPLTQPVIQGTTARPKDDRKSIKKKDGNKTKEMKSRVITTHF